MNKKLYRSPKDGILLGVAAGLGHYFDKDPVLIRIIIVIIAAITKVWPVLLLYGVMFLIVPVDPAQEKVSSDQEPKDVTGSSPPQKEKSKEEEAPTERMDSDQNV